jgi:hypothetical protein
VIRGYCFGHKPPRRKRRRAVVAHAPRVDKPAPVIWHVEREPTPIGPDWREALRQIRDRLVERRP